MRARFAVYVGIVAALGSNAAAQEAGRQEADFAEDPKADAPLEADTLARVRATCVPGVECAELPALFALLADPARGAEAAVLLGSLEDPRAVGPLASAAAYGPTAAVRDAAAQALRVLTLDPDAAAAVARVAESDPDPAVRAAAERALGGRPMLAGATEAPPEADGEDGTDVGPGIDEGIGTAPAETTTGETDTPTEADAPKDDWPDDPYLTRVVLAPTAFTQTEDRNAWLTIGGVYHEFQISAHPNLGVTVGTMLPIGIFAVAPQVTVSGQVAEHVHVGAYGVLALGGPYVDASDSAVWVAAGGGGVLTFGTPDLFANASLLGFAGAELGDALEPAFVPDLALSARLARKVRLNIEVGSVMSDDLEPGETWYVLYGVRLFGERRFGALGMFVPITEDAADALAVFPLGFPYFSFGMLF